MAAVHEFFPDEIESAFDLADATASAAASSSRGRTAAPAVGAARGKRITAAARRPSSYASTAIWSAATMATTETPGPLRDFAE